MAGPEYVDGYTAPSVDPSFEWEQSIEIHLKKLDAKTTIALGCAIAGLGIGALANVIIKKVLDGMQEMSNVVGTLHQIESQRGSFGGPIVQGPAGAHSAPVQEPTGQWGAVRPDTSHIGRTTPAPSSPGIDDSARPYEGTISAPTEGPQSDASAIARAAIASDPIRPANVIKDEGIR